MPTTSETPQLTGLGKLAIALFVLACIGGAYFLANKRNVLPAQLSTATLTSSGKDVHFGIAYGTEKQRWLEWAVAQYKATPAGRHTEIELIPMGSMEGAHAVSRWRHPHPGLVPRQRRLPRYLHARLASEIQHRPHPSRRTPRPHAHGLRHVGRALTRPSRSTTVRSTSKPSTAPCTSPPAGNPSPRTRTGASSSSATLTRVNRTPVSRHSCWRATPFSTRPATSPSPR